MKVACSILSIIEKNIDCKQKIDAFNLTDCNYLHLDIMDGKFVENKTLADEEMLDLVKDIQKPFDVHLMVEDIEKYIEIYKNLKPQYITFHVEATKDPSLWIQTLKKYEIGVGISVKPETPISVLIPYLKEIDLILVMSVEPGHGGQSFLESSISKIEELKKLRIQNGYHYQIEVDGGINQDTVFKVKEADIIVSGSFVTNQENYQNQIDLLRQ